MRLRSRVPAFRRGSVLLLLAALFGVVAVISSAAGAAGSFEGVPSQAERQPTPGPTGVHVVRELAELRTATSDTFLQSDGSRAVKIYTHPVNYRASGGAWEPIESKLARASDGTWHPIASPVPLSLPASLGSGAVELGPAQRRLTFSLRSAAATNGTASGEQAVYSNVLPGVSVSYFSLPESVRETLSLASSSAPSEYHYSLTLSPGLHASLQPGGSVLVREASGTVAYTIAAPTATDSASIPQLPAPGNAHYELAEGGTVLTLVLNRAWLDAPSTVYPVKVDPDVYYAEQQDCSLISEAYANWSPCGGPLYVGADDASPKDVSRALLRFNLSSIPANSDILRSRLALWFDEDTNDEPIDIEAHALTRGFTQDATWNTYNGTNSWTIPGGDFSSELGGETKIYNSYKEYWVDWGFTPTVEKWVREPDTNDGILLKAANEEKAGYDTFFQADNGLGAPEPNMEVEYEPRLGDDGGTDRLLVTQELGNGAVAGVNVADGNLQLTNPDVEYTEGEYTTALSRDYNSLDEELVGSAFGDGWRLSAGQDTLLYPTWWDGSYVFHEPGGMYVRFDRDPAEDGHPNSGDLAYHVPANVNESLVVHSNGTRTLTYNETGVEWKFDNSENGFPQEIVDPNGEGNTIHLGYTGSRLTSLKDTHGHELSLTLNSGTHYVTKISGADGESWEYGYNSSHYLVSYAGPGGQKAEYSYDGDGMLSVIVDPTGTYVISYDSSYRVSSIRRLVNGTVTTPGSEDEITSFSYESAKAPTCAAENDTGQTTVTRMPGEEGAETYCYNAAGEETGYTGPGVEEEGEEASEFEAQPEVPECYPDEGYCGADELESEVEEEEGGADDFHALVESAPGPELKKSEYGISDNNRVSVGSSKFDYFVNRYFKELNVKKVRRIVPWNIVAAGGEELTDVKAWVEKTLALDSDTGEPLITFEQCGGCTPPSEAEYKKAMEEFLGDSVLGKVTHFTAWDEPNAENHETHEKAETYVAPELAGKYWRVLDELCEGRCRVAAGDFLDAFMEDAENAKGPGGQYLAKYVKGMKYAPKARQWAWHAYSDGLDAGTKYAGDPKQWWGRFKHFLGAIKGLSKVNFSIWLTEQGVIYSDEGVTKPGGKSDNGVKIMKAYVETPEPLTRQSPHITMFDYYEMRGEAKSTGNQDSGLLNPVGKPRPIFYVYRQRTNPPK